MEGRYLRIVYAVQFVVTLMAVLETWGQVGGQSHLDLIPWYGKLLLATGLAWAVVKATAAAVEQDKFRNARTLRWLAAALALIATMGILTYYEHLHEPGDDEQEQPGSGEYRPARIIARRADAFQSGAHVRWDRRWDFAVAQADAIPWPRRWRVEAGSNPEASSAWSSDRR